MKRIYLDYAATAPLRPSARDAMLPWLDAAHNASSTHFEGRAARQALDLARDVFATVLGARAREVVFTASGSESVSLALVGALDALGPRGHVYTTLVEHRAVLAAVEQMKQLGWQHVAIDIDTNGTMDIEHLQALLANVHDAQPQLVSAMLVNNELGSINDLAAIAAIAHAHRAIVHCDAIGAGSLVPVATIAKDVDLLSLAAHKFGGPLGVGVLCARAQTPLAPIVFGGGQEFGKRAGTENIAAIVGAAAALREVEATRADEAPRIQALRDLFEATVLHAVPDIAIQAASAVRAPGISNLAIPEIEFDVLPVALDLAGIAASAGSACASGALKRSHVLEAIGYRAGAAMRFSWGSSSTHDETLEAAGRFIEVVLRARTGRSSTLP